MGVISLHNVILGGNDHVENEQDHPLARADRGAGDVHCAVYCGEAADRGHGLPQCGKTYAESQQPGDETPVITGGDFTITAHTFENMCTQNRASGMTEDAYLASMFETRKLMLTLESYTQAQEAAFLAAGHTRDEADAWHDFCYALTKAAVDVQNITLAAPYTWTLTRDNYNIAGTWPELTQSAGAPG